jgi:hypothetical protein
MERLKKSPQPAHIICIFALWRQWKIEYSGALNVILIFVKVWMNKPKAIGPNRVTRRTLSVDNWFHESFPLRFYRVAVGASDT